ncbi:unnamed protein product [Diamesa hyperborea]
MNLSVFELLQRLQGALDDQFRIIDLETVLEVLSYLEAFEFTAEFYQQLQNTRTPKTLQGLRGHKANDQAIAKRVKRLLRKWKENLEASTGGGGGGVVVVNGGVTAVTNSNVINSNNNNSRPISPENCSQQSNDVQFISSHTPQVIPINGTTNNFTNFLQNQHTVPMRSSHEQQTMVLGKRNNKQAELDDHDVDENSNHSRRKKIKETSVVVTVPSPPSIQQKPLTINQNNSINNKNHMTLPPPQSPTVPAQQPPLPPSTVESPKKRGRKKGSKGIDSTLFEASKFLNSTANFKSTIDVDIKQKIASSATKKNKTTKELLADLQKRCKDEMSEDSNHYGMLNGSPDAIIPEWDNSSSNTMDHKFSSHLEPSTLDSTQSGISKKKPLFKNIEEEIDYLRAQLPPIDYEAAANDMDDELNVLDDDAKSYLKRTTQFDDTDALHDTFLDGLNGNWNVNLVYRPSVSSNTIRSNCNRVDSDNREFKEWHEVMNVKSYNEDVLTILPYVVID